MSAIDDREIKEIVHRVFDQMFDAAKPGSPAIHQGTTPAATAPDRTRSESQKVLAIGSDHGGFELKEFLKADLTQLGYEIQDVGTHSKEAVDYPDFAVEVAKLVGAGKAWRGIMIDGAGIGSCIVANKVRNVRAGMAYDLSSAVNSREHNDTNMLTLGAGLVGQNLAQQITRTWLATEFGGGRHSGRVEKIKQIEKQYLK